MPFQPTYPVTEDRRAYTLHAGPVGLLVLHGFMGSPISSHPLADYLCRLGYTVHCPLLPGHGERPDKLHNVPRRAWIEEAAEAMNQIREWCDEVFVLGHSMGSVLAAGLTEAHPDIRGLIMLAPLHVVPSRALHIAVPLRPFVTWLHPWRIKKLRRLTLERVLDLYPDLDIDDPQVQAQLPNMSRVPLSGIVEMRAMAGIGRKLWPQVTQPALILQGGDDFAVRPGGAEAVYRELGSVDKHIHIYPHAGHELMRPKDPAHKQVWPEIEGFIRERSGLATAAAVAGGLEAVA
jgi:carboxylesterase